MKDKLITLIKKRRTWFLLVSLFGAFGVSLNPEVANAVIELLPEIVNTFMASSVE